MISLAHIVNPVAVASQSDLSYAQPVTFATLAHARDYAVGRVDVQLYSAQYAEDHSIVPTSIVKTRDLNRSVLDCAIFKKQRRLPLIADIIERLNEASDATYFIYTNVDIAVQPYFYVLIARLIEEGHEALVINRRVIPDIWRSPADLDRMFAEVGKPHPGYDCFVFRRSILPQCDFARGCIGANWIGRIIISNLLATNKRLTIFKDLHATFHIGEAGAWLINDFNEFDDFNRGELTHLIARLKQRPEVAADAVRLEQLKFIEDDITRWYAPRITIPMPLWKRVVNKLARLLRLK